MKRLFFITFLFSSFLLAGCSILPTHLHDPERQKLAEEIRDEFRRLASPVQKTGGPEEQRAFEFLKDYVSNAITDRE